MTRAVWQISGGPSERSYVDVFLRYGVALIGPGDPGVWTPERRDDEFEGGFVRRLASEVNVGDVFLLRTGMSRICAVGLVASEYLYLSQFDDVNGWDLQQARRVRWCPLPKEHDFGSSIFGGSPSRFSRTWDGRCTDYAERFLSSPPTHWQSALLPELPAEEPTLEDVPSHLQGIVAEVNDLVPQFYDRKSFGEYPTEDELVAHFVVPLLRSLGWPPELIGVEWRDIDVVVFRSLPRSPENCQFVVEAKRLGQGVEGALEQAKGYLKSLGVPRDIVVTDGVRYRMYSCDRDFGPVGYANLARLKRSAMDLFSRLKRP
jgi:hypothetical protein